MDNDANGRAELDEKFLTFDVQDDALERAAAAAPKCNSSVLPPSSGSLCTNEE